MLQYQLVIGEQVIDEYDDLARAKRAGERLSPAIRNFETIEIHDTEGDIIWNYDRLDMKWLSPLINR